MSYESHATTWITDTGSTITVFTFPSQDVDKIKVGVAVNNEYKRESIFNPFSPKQSEKVIGTLLQCGASPKQIEEATNFLHKELRVAQIKEESEIGLGVDTKEGASLEVKKRIEKSTK